MTLFRILLVVIFLSVVSYTAIVIANHGTGLVPIFYGDIAAFTWPGQFNLDFSSYLILSALWVAWRHHFSSAGMALAAVASVAGAMFFCAYLLIANFKAKGDMKELLLGRTRARQ